MLRTTIKEGNAETIVDLQILIGGFGPYRLLAATLVLSVTGIDNTDHFHDSVAVVVIDRSVGHKSFCLCDRIATER